MNYKIALIIKDQELSIPVLPSTIRVSSPGKNQRTTVLELGEVNLLKQQGLRSVAWESFFPRYSAPYVTGQLDAPLETVKRIQLAREEALPLRLLLTGTDLDINCSMGIDTFDYEERSGEQGDIYYSIKLTEWKEYAPSKLTVSEDTLTAEESTRVGSPSTGNTYIVSEGDSLWAIARKIYGKGEDYIKIYEANKALLGSNPNLIYAGQVLTLP